MDLKCRNKKCTLFSRPVAQNVHKCPECGFALLGPSFDQSASGDLAESVRNDGLLQRNGRGMDGPPAVAPITHVPPGIGELPKMRNRGMPETSARPRKPNRSDPNSTRGIEDAGLDVEARPQYVVERIERGQPHLVGHVDEMRGRRLFSQGTREERQHLADIRSAKAGVRLTPANSGIAIFVQVRSPIGLSDGLRIRIGNYVMKARIFTRGEAHDPAGDADETDVLKELTANGELVFLRPDGSEGLHFPILKQVLIGRGRPGDPRVDIPLLDANVSRRHAAVAPSSSHGLKLKNLSQTDGTFIEVRGTTTLVEGDRFRLGDCLFKLAKYDPDD
jgi:FHA domain